MLSRPKVQSSLQQHNRGTASAIPDVRRAALRGEDGLQGVAVLECVASDTSQRVQKPYLLDPAVGKTARFDAFKSSRQPDVFQVLALCECPGAQTLQRRGQLRALKPAE